MGGEEIFIIIWDLWIEDFLRFSLEILCDGTGTVRMSYWNLTGLKNFEGMK